MRNIFIGFLLCGASFLTFVQSTTFPGTYLTGKEDVEYQKLFFSDFDRKGVLVNYQFVPLKTVESSRVRRQAPPSEQKTQDNVKQQSSPVKKQTTDPIKPGVAPSIAKLSNDGSTNTTLNNNPVTNLNSSSSSASSNNSNLNNSTVPSTTSGSLNNNTNSSTTNGITTSNSTIHSDDQDDFYARFPVFNKTIPSLNSTEKYQFNVSESHKYYFSNTIPNGSVYWQDLSENNQVEEHELLSNSHRRAATINLKFKFPFYGNLIENVTVATGGFIYLGDHVHAWLAATQYVAPLMANFDSSKSKNASVRYLSTSSSFTVEWSQVPLQDSPEKGPFTFEASLYENGTILFAYKALPIDINEILDHAHPVKVGLSDAYIRDKNVLFVKQKTIYEYDRVDLRTEKITIRNGTAIVFIPKPTCQPYSNCTQCANHDTEFDCSWCPIANRCSDGTDRYRHDWLNSGCDKLSLKTVEQCLAHPTTYIVNNNTRSSPSSDNHAKIDTRGNHGDQAAAKQQHHDGNSGMGAGGVIGVLVLVILIVTGVGWVFYAYVFPHSTSGQLLIRYRPSQWSFSRRGTTRYTAASIHM